MIWKKITKLSSEPAQSALANLLELKQQVEESIKVNHLVEFKDKQVTDIDSKMQELNKSMEFEINFCFKEYIFDSLAQVLNQIKIDVIVVPDRWNAKNSWKIYSSHHGDSMKFHSLHSIELELNQNHV